MAIENLWNNLKERYTRKTTKLADNRLYQYGVDVLSGWSYYTLTYGLQELAAGKDLDTIWKTRLIGMGAQAIAMRPVGLLREHFAKKWGVTKKSPAKDKIKVNLIAMPIQSLIYAGVLTTGMAWSGNYDLKSSAYALGIGIGLEILHSFPLGICQDKIREKFGIKPAFVEEEPEVIYTEPTAPQVI